MEAAVRYDALHRHEPTAMRSHTAPFLFLIAVLSAGAADAQRISAGQYNSFFLCGDSTVNGWGDNSFGALGNNDTQESWTPVQVVGLTGVVAISDGKENHALALKNDGTVWSWGANSFGQLGDGSTSPSGVPIQAGTNDNAVAVSAGGFHSLALMDDSTVWSWGYNYYGQLGDGTTSESHSPVQVIGLDSVVAIAAGWSHSMALRADSTVWVWGSGIEGALGNGGNADSHVPVSVPALTGITAISASRGHSMALASDSTVWCWGFGSYGQLGNGVNANSNVPVMAAPLSQAIAISAGYVYSAALLSDGTVWTWGRNFTGVLGNGTNTDSNVPVETLVPTGIVAISAGHDHCMALRDDGSAWSWGWSVHGQIGDGFNQDRNVPVPVIQLCPGASDIAETPALSVVSVFPNPAEQVFTIAAPGNIFDLTVLDPASRVVMTRSRINGQAVIDISALPVGVYALRMVTREGRLMCSRVVKY